MSRIKGQIKTVDFEQQNFKVASSEDRIIEGYFTTTTVDRGGDVSLPTAFTKTLETYMENPVVTFMHDIKKIVGKVIEYKMDDLGVWVKIQIAKGVKFVDEEMWPLIEQGMLKGFSYGYKTTDEEKGQKDGRTVNFLKEVELFEVAVVSVPMNSSALFAIGSGGDVKSITLCEINSMKTPEDVLDIKEYEEEKAMTHNSTLSDNEPAWGTVDKTVLPDNAFADSKDRKYPHHWVSGDTMDLHKQGLGVAFAAAHGARSGQEADAAVKTHLEAHRKAIGMEDNNMKLSEEEKQEIVTALVAKLKEEGFISIKAEIEELLKAKTIEEVVDINTEDTDKEVVDTVKEISELLKTVISFYKSKEEK